MITSPTPNFKAFKNSGAAVCGSSVQQSHLSERGGPKRWDKSLQFCLGRVFRKLLSQQIFKFSVNTENTTDVRMSLGCRLHLYPYGHLCANFSAHKQQREESLHAYGKSEVAAMVEDYPLSLRFCPLNATMGFTSDPSVRQLHCMFA